MIRLVFMLASYALELFTVFCLRGVFWRKGLIDSFGLAKEGWFLGICLIVFLTLSYSNLLQSI